MDLLAAKGCSKSLDTLVSSHLQCIGRLQGSPMWRGLLAVHGGFWIAGHQFDPVRSDRDRVGKVETNSELLLLFLPILGQRRNVKQTKVDLRSLGKASL